MSASEGLHAVGNSWLRRPLKPRGAQRLRLMLERMTGANPEELLAEFERIAGAELRARGLPHTADALAAHDHYDGVWNGQTVGERIETDPTLEERVRVYARILFRVSQVRAYLAANNARAALTENNRLHALAMHSVWLEDAADLQRERAAKLGRMKGSQIIAQDADRRAAIFRALLSQVHAKNPNLSRTAAAEEVAKLARAQDPELFPKQYSGHSVLRLLRKKGEK